jgi:hypothetical protein
MSGLLDMNGFTGIGGFHRINIGEPKEIIISVK